MKSGYYVISLICDYNEVRLWYDGYHFADNISIYSPRSVVSAMLRRRFGNYWNQTESFEALKIYIEMNYDGLKDKIIHIMAGEDQIINIGKFVNDMITFNDADDVLTLLVHLGYLSYNCETEKVSIPNKEISNEYINAMEGAGWNEILDTIKKSEQLLLSTWRLDEDAVAEGIQNAHMETSHLTYSDENALSYTISLAYYSARQYYTIIRELPSGSVFADVVFLPRKKYFDKPAMIVELKWNKSVQGAIAQIKNKKYIKALEDYRGNLLLVAVNYDKKKRNHQCHIEKFALEENGRKE